MTAKQNAKPESSDVQIADISVQERIFTLRGEKVILDSDLAAIYGVETKRLNEQVRRNADRFPSDFAFILIPQEVANLRSQIATSSLHGGRRYAADRECLELFRRLCRHYWDIDPAATAGYVQAYREMWDSDASGEKDSKA